MRGVFLILIVSSFLNSTSLIDIINSTKSKNGYIKAKEYELMANKKSISSIKSSFMPKVNVASTISINSPKTFITPQKSINLSLLLSAKVYDSKKRANQIRAKEYEGVAKDFEIKALKRSLTIKAINIYYSYFKALANKRALLFRQRAIKEQIKRVKRLLNAGLTTKVELYRLKAALAQNDYALESINFALKSAKENLQTISHKRIDSLKYNTFIEPKRVKFKESEDILKIRANAEALKYNKRATLANKKPQVDISYSYTKSKYSNIVKSPLGDLPEHNSKLNIQASLMLYDGGSIKELGESLEYKKLALLSKANELKREQKRDFTLAKLKLKSIKANIKSAKLALLSANESYKRVKKEYVAGFVDYITYLDALTQKSISEAKYKETLYDYEVAKAYLYYYSGRDLKGYIK